MKLFGYRAFAVVAIVALAARPASAQVVNGGFESGTFAGWNHNGNIAFDYIYSGFDAHSGTYGAIFGPYGGPPSFLGQSLATTTGQGYTLSFWLRNDGGTPSSFDVSWGGSSLFSLTDPAGFQYTEYNFNVVGGVGASTPLVFTFRQDPGWWSLDDVSLTENGINPNGVVPEPATMSLLATGLAGMAGAGLRRRRKQA